MVDMPEEVCDLNPEKICRYKTALVPSLIPQQECTQVPKESCHLSFSSPEPGKKPLLTKWCLEPELPQIQDNSLGTGGISEDGNLDSLDTGVFDLRAAEGQENPDVAGLLDVTQELVGNQNDQPTYGNVDLSQSVYSLQGETVGQFYGAPREARGTGWRQNLKKTNKNNNKHSSQGLKQGTKQITRSSKEKRFQRFPKQDRSERKSPRSSRSATGGRKRQNQSDRSSRKATDTSSRKATKQGKSRVVTKLAQL